MKELAKKYIPCEQIQEKTSAKDDMSKMASMIIKDSLQEHGILVNLAISPSST